MKTKFWENLGFLSLGLCLFGQMSVGWFYLPAQFAYLVANIIAVLRTFILDRPISDKIRDTVFTAITIALIAIRIFGS